MLASGLLCFGRLCSCFCLVLLILAWFRSVVALFGPSFLASAPRVCAASMVAQTCPNPPSPIRPRVVTSQLIKAGANLEATDEDGRTPLSFAASGGYE